MKIPVEAVEEQLATWRDATWRLSMACQRVLQVLIGSIVLVDRVSTTTYIHEEHEVRLGEERLPNFGRLKL